MYSLLVDVLSLGRPTEWSELDAHPHTLTSIFPSLSIEILEFLLSPMSVVLGTNHTRTY